MGIRGRSVCISRPYPQTKTPTHPTPHFRGRCVAVKESQAELVKHHLSVLWTDFFKPHHLEQFPGLHDMFWNAIKAAGDAKKSTDPAVAEDLVAQIEGIAEVFWQTKESANVGLYPPS